MVGKTFIYLDYNATAPMRPEVVEAMRVAFERGGNASSVHGSGRRAREAVDQARASVARLVGAPAEQVVFTSGGTEANNLALKGTGRRRLMISAVEHGSVLATALMADPGATILAVGGEGVVDLAALAQALAAQDEPSLVAVMLANNETGVVQPVERIAAIAHRHEALVHCDAVQAAGKIPVDWTDLGADFMSLSAHKLGGPQGVGALVVDERVALAAQLTGGGQEMGRRSGTENVPGIVGFGVAAELAQRDLARFEALATMRDDMEHRLKEIARRTRCFGADAERLPNTSCLAMPGVSAETQVMAFDLAGFAVSAGAACSSGKVARSHVLEAMGAPEDEAECAIRVSLGWRSERDDVDRFVAAWSDLYGRASANHLAAAETAA